MISKTVKMHFVASLRRVLRPIVRQAIAYGISYSAFVRLLKSTYVEVADDEFALPFKRQTDSRLALLTGISRKDVSTLRDRRTADTVGPDVEDSVATHAVGLWMAGPPYATPGGKPRRLQYESTDAADPTFSSLVRTLGGDIPVRAILDELIRLGSVVLHSNGEVALVREAHIPTTGLEGKLRLLGSDPAELYGTITHNIDDDSNPWLQRKVVYDNIGSDALESLREESREAGEDFIRRANALVASYDRDREENAPGGDRSRVVIGAYYHEQVSKGDEKPAKHPRAGGPPGRIKKAPTKSKPKKSGK